MAFKIVHEYEPDQFRLFQKGRVAKTFTTANRVIEYADGRRDREEVTVAPYQADIVVSSIAGWNADELASCKLHKVVPFDVPRDKAPNGDPVFSRVNGTVIETVPLKDAPPEPSVEQKIEQVLVHVGMTREELKQALADRQAAVVR